MARPSLDLPDQVLAVVLLGTGCCTRWSSESLPTNIILCSSALKADASFSDLKKELCAAKFCLFLIQSGEQIKHTTSFIDKAKLLLESSHTKTLFQYFHF